LGWKTSSDSDQGNLRGTLLDKTQQPTHYQRPDEAIEAFKDSAIVQTPKTTRQGSP
jgi:hypothetical protein